MVSSCLRRRWGRGGEGVSGERREIGGGVRCEGERVWTRAGAAVSSCVRDKETSHSQFRSRMERDSEYHGPILSVPRQIQDTVAAAASVHVSSDSDDAISTAGSESGSSCESHVTGSDDEEAESPALSEDCITCDHNSPTQVTKSELFFIFSSPFPHRHQHMCQARDSDTSSSPSISPTGVRTREQGPALLD